MSSTCRARDPQSRSRLAAPEEPCAVVHHQGDGGERGHARLVEPRVFY